MLWKMRLRRLNRCDFNGGVVRVFSRPGRLTSKKAPSKELFSSQNLVVSNIFFFIFTPPRIVCGKMIPFLTKIAHIFQNGLVKNYQLEKERKESPQASFFRGKLAKT